MAKSSRIDTLLRLPQRDELWVVASRAMPAWVEDPLSDPYRPQVILIIEESTGLVRRNELLEDTSDLANDVRDALHRAMLGEPWGETDEETPPQAREPYRPARVLVEGESLGRALRGWLERLHIESRSMDHIPQIDDMMREMEERLRLEDRGNTLSLADIPGISASNLHEFYAAAAGFYEAAPWKWLSNLHFIEAHYSAEDTPWIVCIMGNGRREYGLSLYSSLQQFETLSHDKSRGAWRRHGRGQTISSVTFNPPWEGLAFRELDDIARYRFPIAAQEAYPLLLKLTLPDTRIAPSFEDVSRFSALMRALPEFVRTHMDAIGKLPRPAEATLTLPEIYNGHTVRLRFPVASDTIGDVIRTPDMEARGLVDADALGAWLLQALKARLPFPVRLDKAALADVHDSKLRIRQGQRLTCVDILSTASATDEAQAGEDTSAWSELMCALRTGRETLVIPLKYVDTEDPDLPFRNEIKAYVFASYCSQMDAQEKYDDDEITPEILDEAIDALMNVFSRHVFSSLLPGRKPARRPKKK